MSLLTIFYLITFTVLKDCPLTPLLHCHWPGSCWKRYHSVRWSVVCEQKMVKDNNLLRHLHACERMANVTWSGGWQQNNCQYSNTLEVCFYLSIHGCVWNLIFESEFLKHIAQQKMTALVVVPSGFTAGLMTQFCILQGIIHCKT